MTPHNSMAAKARQQRYIDAIGRPELRGADKVERAAPSGATSPTIKVVDAETRRLIDEAIIKRKL